MLQELKNRKAEYLQKYKQRQDKFQQYLTLRKENLKMVRDARL